MAQAPQLRIPGPTPVPDRINRAMAAPMINHRGPEFKALLPELESGLKWAFQTENDMLIFPASGTGGLESAVANLLSPGERVLAVTIGAFGDRFADLAEAFLQSLLLRVEIQAPGFARNPLHHADAVFVSRVQAPVSAFGIT